MSGLKAIALATMEISLDTKQIGKLLINLL